MKRAKAIGMKLLSVSRKLGVSHQLILIRFFHERLLFRLSVSPYNNRFCLKGGHLLYALQGNEARPTLDLDFSVHHLTNDKEEARLVISEILRPAFDDQVLFDAQNMVITNINEQNLYSGVRLKIPAQLANIRQMVQMDMGFGDVVTPHPVTISYPVILSEFDSPVIQAYTMETVIAEKLQAIIVLAQLNSRMKDFYDIHTILTTSTINLTVLQEAITLTFANRNTPLNFHSVVFTRSFYADVNRNKMWLAFLKKINTGFISFEYVVKNLHALVQSIFIT